MDKIVASIKGDKMFGCLEADDFMIAVRAAEAMCRHLQQDIVILKDFRVVPLLSNDELPLEIIRFNGERI